MSLQNFPFSKKGKRLNIIHRAASEYSSIGIYLLNDGKCAAVKAIELSTHYKAEAAMQEIFTKWVNEDTKCSWEKLIECLKICKLSDLAKEIEDGLKSVTELYSEFEGCLLLVVCSQYNTHYVHKIM